ncbi:MAG: hypothetical protein KKE30_09060 [Gammaproteobacteria bacterium]|nr:hypothetical protein [Gammaproteobacteria bacterium]
MHQMSDQQLSPTLVVKSLLNNGFTEFSFADFHQEFKRHFPMQSAKSVYQSLYRVVDRFVKKGYLVKHTQPDNTIVFKQTDLLRDLGENTQANAVEDALSHTAQRLRNELASAEDELWVSSSAADQCQKKMLGYPQMRAKLSKMHMEYKEKSLSKLGEVDVLRRMLVEIEKL